MAPESTSASTVQIVKPAAGETLNITSVPGGNLAFSFDPAAATITRAGNDLVVEVDGGGTVHLNDFFVVGDQPLPSLTMPDGVSVASADFLSSFNVELETAAGPGAGAAGAPGSGSGEYADNAGSLVDGIDRLGSLGTDYWGYESEVTERFEGQLADAGTGLPGLPGVPGVPGDPPYTPPVTVEELHAHPNTENVTIETGYAKIQTGTKSIEGGGSFDVSFDSKITGKLGDHQSGQEKQSFYGITSSSGDYGVLQKTLGFDLKSLIEGEDGSWKSKGSSVGAAESGVIKLDAAGDLTADWTMVPNNSGSVEGKVSDASIAFLYRINADNTRTLIDHSDLFRYDDAAGKNYAIKDCSFTWDNLEPGNYVIVYAVAEAGQGNGQKTILCPGEASYTGDIDVPVYSDTYSFALSAGGNVIQDPNADPNADPDHLEDHHTSYGQEDIAVTGISSSFFDGDVQFLNGEFVATGTYRGFDFTFTMTPKGDYAFNIEGKGMAVTLDDLKIQYEIETPDGKTANADLSLKSDYSVIDLSEAGAAGDDGNNIIYGTTGDDLIYGGLGDDIMHGGQGADTFAWKTDHLSGKDTIMDFELGTDTLRFDDYFGNGGATIDNILAKLAPSAEDRLELLSADELSMSLKVGGLTVDIHFEGNGLTAEQVAVATGGDTEAQAALLLTLLS